MECHDDSAGRGEPVFSGRYFACDLKLKDRKFTCRGTQALAEWVWEQDRQHCEECNRRSQINWGVHDHRGRDGDGYETLSALFDTTIWLMRGESPDAKRCFGLYEKETLEPITLEDVRAKTLEDIQLYLRLMEKSWG